jgi:uncharacterized membrane protein YfcA
MCRLEGEMDWILFLIAGALAGSLVSMTGSGAGFLLVPGLSIALSFSACPDADLFKIAVATTHGANIITNLAAFQAHALRRSIDWMAFIRLGPGSIVGAAAGAILATHLDTAILELVLIVFAVALSARLLRQHRKIEPKNTPPLIVWVTRSTAMGVLAALTGAGGVLPLFLKEYLPPHKVVGTTVAGCLIMSIPAALTYYAFSPPPVRCGSDCLGPIFLPGMFAAGIASSLAAPLGAWLSHAVPPVIRRRAFSALLLLVVANILVKRGSLIAPASLSASELVGAVQERPVESGAPPAWIGEPAHVSHGHPVSHERGQRNILLRTMPAFAPARADYVESQS